jgi:hypothetical protein
LILFTFGFLLDSLWCMTWLSLNRWAIGQGNFHLLHIISRLQSYYSLIFFFDCLFIISSWAWLLTHDCWRMTVVTWRMRSEIKDGAFLLSYDHGFLYLYLFSFPFLFYFQSIIWVSSTSTFEGISLINTYYYLYYLMIPIISQD